MRGRGGLQKEEKRGIEEGEEKGRNAPVFDNVVKKIIWRATFPTPCSPGNLVFNPWVSSVS